MTTQAKIYDKIYAERSPEFIHRQRIANEEYARRQSQEQSSKEYTAESLLRQTGQSSIVYLHHLTTRRQIGEAVKVHYKSHDILMFELLRYPGKMLRVNPSGKVDFASVQDDTAIFQLEATPSGSLYFLSKAYSKSINISGGIGWYLFMSEQGKLSGDGAKMELSQWTMVNATTKQISSITNPSSSSIATSDAISNNSIGNSNSSQKQEANSSTTAATYDHGFPGVGSGRELLMRFFRTEEGVTFLQQPEYSSAYKLFRNKGVLSKILHRPDWPLVANRFEDYTTLADVSLDRNIVNQYVSFAGFKQFYENGFVVCRNVISSDLLQPAAKIVNYWISKNMNHNNNQTLSNNNGKGGISFLPRNHGLELIGDIATDLDILALYYNSPLTHILQYMLGSGDVEKVSSAQIITTFPTLELLESPALFGNKWVIDGFTHSGSHSPYTVLIGVALTDINEINQGNFCIHSGSHLMLLEEYLDHVKKKKVLFSENPNTCTKPDLGEPTQLIMKAGDVFLCTQRCAYLQSINIGANPTSIVYFRVSHIDHAILKQSSLESIWVEYKSASYYLESTNEDEVTTTTTTSIDDLLTSPSSAVPSIENVFDDANKNSNKIKEFKDLLGGTDDNHDNLFDESSDVTSSFLLSPKQKKIVSDLLANDNVDSKQQQPHAEENELWNTFPEKHSSIQSNQPVVALEWSTTNPMILRRNSQKQQQQQQQQQQQMIVSTDSITSSVPMQENILD